MAELQAVVGKQELGGRAGQSRTEGGQAGYGVDVGQVVEKHKIQADHRPHRPAHGVDAADHAGSAAEGHHRDLFAAAPAQDVQHLVVGGGGDDGIGHVMGSAEAPSDEVGVGLAAGAPQLLGEVRGHPVGADDVRQRGEVIGGQPRFGDGDVAFGDTGQGLVDAEALGEQRAHATRQRLGLVRGAPEVELHRRAGNSDGFLAAHGGNGTHMPRVSECGGESYETPP